MWVQVQGDGRVPVTRLSRGAGNLRTISLVSRLAWRSLLLISIMLVEGSCIVADPPEYRAPGQTRPVLNVYGAVPTATRALVLYTPTRTSFSVQVRSEDAGEDLRAIFFMDYQIKPGERVLISKTITASTYDNEDRTATLDWIIPMMALKGCHYVSLVVAHENSFLKQIDETRLDPRRADDDAAIVTWTVSIDPTENTTLENCPSVSAPPPPVP